MADTDTKAGSKFGRSFYGLCSVELFERLAYFGVRAVVPVFIMQADDPGGLHLTAAHKGTIYAWWFIFQSVLPMFTGGYADRYGYKKTMAFSVAMNIAGYVIMAFSREYWSFFLGVMVLATGTAFFKPSIQGSLAQNLTKDISSLGWGIFYWVVNIGGAAGPFVANAVLGNPHSAEGWRNLFLVSAAFTSVNFLLMLTFKDVPSGASKTESVVSVFKRTVTNILEPRLVAWLLIMACFWLMMYQLWDLHPNFITDWIDTSDVAALVHGMPGSGNWITEAGGRGPQMRQEILLSLNAILIIALMVPVSWAVRKMRTLSAMLIGMSVATVGVLVAGFATTGAILVLGIVFFSLGEMLTGPKKNEYLGLIAPPGKKGLYLGYVNIPIGIGGFIGSKLAGFVYGNYGEKATLSLKYLANETPLGAAKHWNGDIDTLESTLGIERSEAFAALMEQTGKNAVEATQLLWDTYDPQYAVWLPFAAIGVVAIIALAIFGQMAKKWKDMNA